jgi:hypothetical protein
MKTSSLIKQLGLIACIYMTPGFADVMNTIAPSHPSDMAVATAPTSTVNTPSMNPAMPVSKPSTAVKNKTDTATTESHGLKNAEDSATTNSITASTPKPPSPIPETTPAPTNTQMSPSNIVVPAGKQPLPTTTTPY